MRSLLAIIAWLALINRAIAHVAKVGACALVGAMTVGVLVQVFYRYVLNDPLTWTEEFSIFAMIWMTFLVGPVAYRAGANVGIDILRDMLGGRLRAVLEIALTLLVMLVLAVLLERSIGYAARGFKINASSLPLTMGWIYIAMPLGVGAMLLVGVELLLRAITNLADPEQPLHPPDDAALRGVDTSALSGTGTAA